MEVGVGWESSLLWVQTLQAGGPGFYIKVAWAGGGGLNGNGTHRLTYLDAWSAGSGTVFDAIFWPLYAHMWCTDTTTIHIQYNEINVKKLKGKEIKQDLHLKIYWHMRFIWKMSLTVHHYTCRMFSYVVPPTLPSLALVLSSIGHPLLRNRLAKMNFPCLK